MWQKETISGRVRVWWTFEMGPSVDFQSNVNSLEFHWLVEHYLIYYTINKQLIILPML